jgi:hypothetical protein
MNKEGSCTATGKETSPKGRYWAELRIFADGFSPCVARLHRPAAWAAPVPFEGLLKDDRKKRSEIKNHRQGIAGGFGGLS